MESVCYWKNKPCISMIPKKDFFDQYVYGEKKHFTQPNSEEEFF
jgi:hypothetical protein